MSTKVLVIDDDVLLTNMLRDTLGQDDFEVFVANAGVEGVKLAQQLQPDVIVLDLMMPGMSGWEACKTIRSFSPTPILILSAVVDSEMVMRAMDEGADDYMLKPTTSSLLASRLRRLTQQARITRKD